jgi:hypothetical protein
MITPPPAAQMASALQGPQSPAISAMFATPQQRLQQMAGSVLPLPVAPNANAGPPNPLQANQAALQSYLGNRNDNVVHAPVPIFQQYVHNKQR